MNKSEIAERPLCGGFVVKVNCHNEDAFQVLESPEDLRFKIGHALDISGLEEEVDYTLEVSRFYE